MPRPVEEEVEDVSLPVVPVEAWVKLCSAQAVAMAERRRQWMRAAAAQANEYWAEQRRLEEEARERWRLRELEYQKEVEAHRARREAARLKRQARQAEIDEQNRVRREKHQAFAAAFEAAGGRARWVAVERAKGRLLREIADDLGISADRVKQLQLRHEERSRHSLRIFARNRAENLGRPVDMGGPRDVWLEYGPSTDPRLDNFTAARP